MMSDDANEERARRRPHSQTMAAPYLEFDLVRELEQIHREPEWKSGHNTKTLAKYDNLRIVLIALKARARIPGHQTDGRISIQTIQGQIQLRAEGRTFELSVGTLLTLDQGLRHEIEALEDSAFLLTIAWPGKGDQ
jgi:quercetin dioxygenase-like cupin family protein